MDSLDDIFYVVVVVAAILGSVIKSFRKQRNTVIVRRPSSSLPPEQDLEPEQELEPNTEPDYDSPVQQPYVSSAPKDVFPHEPQPTDDVVAPQPVATARTAKKHAAVADEPTDAPLQPVVDFTDLDDVRRAVVANEVLNRKYC